MDWIRAREMLSGPTMAPTSKPQAIPPIKHTHNQSQSQSSSAAEPPQPQFYLVDGENRVRELTSLNGHAGGHSQISSHSSSSAGSSLSGSAPISIPMNAKNSPSPNGAIGKPPPRQMGERNGMDMPTMITSNAMRSAHQYHDTNSNASPNGATSNPMPIGRAIPIANRPMQHNQQMDAPPEDLETQLKYQQEEMRLFPRPPSSYHSNNSHGSFRNGMRQGSQFGLGIPPSSSSSSTNGISINTASPNLRSQPTPHAFTFSESSAPVARTPLRTNTTPLPAPPSSPFANMALSAPTTSHSMGFGSFGTGNGNSNGIPINRDAPGGGLPRLPSFEVFRAGSPGNAMNMGNGPLINLSSSATSNQSAKLPPPLSLRGSAPSLSNLSTLSSSFGSMDQNNASSSNNGNPGMPMYSSSFTSPSPSTGGGLPTFNSIISPGATPMFSQSLPGPNFLRERRASIASVTDNGNNEPWVNSSEDEDSVRLGSSMEEKLRTSLATQLTMNPTPLSSSLSSTPRAGRVCRHANCTNIARSRGLCRTHGGGKRCSHPNCTKSAQANRKCIAHGGGTPCSFADCDKTAQSRGLCKAHGGGARCKYPNCTKSSQSRGLCRGHGGGIKCKEEGCEKWVQKNGYCIKHGRERAASVA